VFKNVRIIETMNNPIYVLNVSSLQLPRLIEKATRGLGDLLPGESGKVPPEVANHPRIKIWIEQKRLKVITEEEFLKSFEKKSPDQQEAPPKTENFAFKSKHRVEKTGDGTTIIIPGIEQLPEIDSIPEPEVSNLDGFIAIKAPRNDEPLTERAGDPVEVTTDDLRVSILNNDGSLTKNASASIVTEQTSVETRSDTPVVTEETPAKMEVVAKSDGSLTVTTNASITLTASEPLVDSFETVVETLPEVPVDNGVTPSASCSVADEILKLKAWKQQVKAVKGCSDPEVLLVVAEKTSYNKVKEACTERLAQIAK
jgi:hypothetical protein